MRLSDRAVDHLRQVIGTPDFSATKYALVEAIGHGGMGTVYRAQDRELGRDVAIKVVDATGDEMELGTRLTREAQTLAALEHPGIVPVHDVGVLPDGRTFYVMKLVRGMRLDAWARESRPLTDRLRVVERLCEAVSFAHAHGVIHRDLKPANIMVGAFGEVLVLDWGVAKRIGDRVSGVGDRKPGTGHGGPGTSDSTAHGTVLGTPGYMAPEQAAGDVDRVDHRADVFALGAILRDVTSGESALPRALQAVIAKAMAIDPDARYGDVSALAADLASYREGAAVSAYREGVVARAARLARRYRTPLVLILAYLIMRIVLLVFSS
jgi:eukaryotic-like serine/threonine-protein kinase